MGENFTFVTPNGPDSLNEFQCVKVLFIFIDQGWIRVKRESEGYRQNRDLGQVSY